MNPLRIVVVDDSALFRTVLRNVFSEIPGCQLVASVGDGRTAVEKIAELRPDLVTLDMEMPEFNGIEVLRELKRRRLKSKVVMVSRHTSAGAAVTTDALIEGAFDFVLKPSGASPAENKSMLRSALEEKIAMLLDGADLAEIVPKATSVFAAGPPSARLEAVVIGCSTGGPDALARVIPNLPADLPVPVFVVQHMPEGFTRSLASRLNEASELEVLEADHGLSVRPGQVIVARGGRHLRLERRSRGAISLALTDDPPEHRCRPAVDYTLRSAAQLFDGKLLAVILTGMGRDGTAGCELVRAQGGVVLAQHATGCVVYGMPKAVIQAGLAHKVMPLSQVASQIEAFVRGRDE